MTEPNASLYARARLTGTIALVVSCVVALLAVSTTPPAAAQDSTEAPASELTDLDKLLERRASLPDDIAEATTTLRNAEATIADLSDGVSSTELQLELLLDDLTRAVEDRDVPQRIQQQAAIARFVDSDQPSEGLVGEIDSFNIDIEPQNRQKLYSVVVEDAGNEVEVARQRLRDLGDAVDELRNSQRSRFSELDAARSARASAAAKLSVLNEDTEIIDQRIDWLESLADGWVLTGMPGPTIDRPALAVKIDNVDAARPQTGINQADIVFEEQVEDGRTRLIAIFQSGDSNPVGPIRSVRTSDIEILSNLGSPLFASSGGNDGARSALRNSTLIDVGHDAESGAYYRQAGRRAPHNLFTSTVDLYERAGSRSSTPPPQLRFRSPGEELPESAIDIAGVAVPFGKTDIEYRWNGTGWARSQNGSRHVDSDGVQVAPPNVIIQFVGYRPSAADGRSPEAIMVGGAPAWMLLDGKLIEGTWNRPTLESHTVFRDADDNLVELNPGKTWITLARTDRASIIE